MDALPSQTRLRARLKSSLLGAYNLIQAGFVDLLFSQIFIQGCAYLLQFVVAGVVGAEQFAPVRIAETWLALAILPAAFGMPTAVVKYTAERSRTSSGLVLSYGLAMVVLGSHIIATICFFAVGMFASPQAVSLVRILVWSLAFSAVTRTILAYFQGLKEIKKAARVNVVLSIIGLAGTTGLTYLLGLPGWLIGRFLSEMVFAIWMLLLVRRQVRFAWKPELLGSMARMGVFAMLSLLAGRAALQADILLLDFLVKDQVLIGNYGVASLARSAMMLPTGAIAAILLPYLVGKLGNIAQGTKFFLQMAAYGLGVALVLGLLVLLFPDSLFVTLFGPDYILAIQYVRALLPAIICGALLTLTNNFLVALERTDLSFYTSLAGLVVNTGLILWLVPGMGIIGGIIAADATYVLELVGQATMLAVLIRKKQRLAIA